MKDKKLCDDEKRYGEYGVVVSEINNSDSLQIFLNALSAESRIRGINYLENFEFKKMKEKKSLFYVFMAERDIDRKFYIGQALNTEKRFKEHCKGNYDNSLIDKAIQKYGKQHFWFEILESQIENYNEREKYWIKYYNSKVPFGYNILDGGENPPVHYGDSNPNVRTSDADVILLKEDLKTTQLSLLELDKKYNISKRQVIRINQGVSRAKIREKYPIREKPNINGKLTEQDVDEIIEILKS